MITYYRDDSVEITSAAVRVDGRAYPLAELARVWHRRGARSWRALAGRGAFGLALAAPVVAALLALGLAVLLDVAPLTKVAIVLGAVLLGLATGPVVDFLLEYVDRSYTRGTREREIWVAWRNTQVRLVRTRDAMRFGRIYRALQRALEQPAPRPVMESGRSAEC